MTEPAQLTRSRNQIMVAAWFQCCSLYIEGDPCTDDYQILRRCPGTRMEAHHVQKRSGGGGHEPENLLAWCSDCHTAFEQTPKRNGPFTDDAGRKFYTEDIGDRHEIHKVRVYSYLDFEPELQDRHIEVFALLKSGVIWGKKSQYATAYAFEEMQRLALWQMDSDLSEEDRTFGDYLRNRGVAIADSTLASYIANVSMLRAKGVTADHLIGALEECSKVHTFPAGFSSIRDNAARLRPLSGEEIIEVMASTPSSEVKAVLSDRIEDKANQAALEKGEIRVTCSATLTVELEHTFTSVGSVEADRKKFEGRIVAAIGKRGVPGSFRFKHHGEPVRLQGEE